MTQAESRATAHGDAAAICRRPHRGRAPWRSRTTRKRPKRGSFEFWEQRGYFKGRIPEGADAAAQAPF